MEAREEGGAEMPRQSLSAHIELLERDVERAAVERLIAAAQAGFHLLALEGPPGIGKTALIAETKVPDGAEASIGSTQTIDELGVRAEIEESGRYDALRPKLWSMDRATQLREMRKMAAAPTSCSTVPRP